MYCFYFTNPLIAFANYWSNLDSFIFANIPFEVFIAIPALLIAMFVPIAIFMVDKNDNAFLWDKAVIFQEVLKAKIIFWGIIIFITIPFLWSWGQIKIVLLMFSLAFTLMFLLAIIESFKWLTVIESKNQNQESYRTRKREKYLKTLSDNQKLIIWSLTWNLERDSRGVIDERKLIKIFINNIEDMDPPNANILRNFISNLDKVNISDPVIHEDLIVFCLKNATYLAKVDGEREGSHDRLDFGHTVRDLYFKIMEKDLTNDFGVYLFFAHTRKYTGENNNTDESILIKNFASQFLNAIENNDEIYQIFRAFPEEWKITSSAIENKDNQSLALGWLGAYMHWIVSKNLLSYESNEFSYDSNIDQITEGLIPDVDLPTWSDLVIFHWSSFGQDEQETQEHAKIRNFIDSKKRFGLISKAGVFWENEKENTEEHFARVREKGINETFNLATKTTIFPLFLNKSSLDKLIDEINKYNIGDDITKKEKWERLKSMLEEIQMRTNEL